jgi:transposase
MECANTRPVRWITPPWDCNTSDWLDIDRRLASDHPARLVARLVDECDLTDLRKSYAGRGTFPHRPELLLRLVLFECLAGKLSAVQWHSDSQELDPVKWLLFGLQPSLSSLYAFRDRCAPVLDGLNRQLLDVAQAEGFVTANDVALDGTFVSSLGSRHRLANSKTLVRRLEQLDAAVAADYAVVTKVEPSHEERSLALRIAKVAVPADPSSSTSAAALPELATEESAAIVGAADVTALAGSLQPAPGEAPPTPEREKSTDWMAKTPAGRFKQHMRYRKAQEILKRKQQARQRTISRRAKAKRQPVERVTISLNEPDAALGRDKLKTFRPLYNLQLACAIDAPFVVGYDVIAEVTDAGQLGRLACRIEDLCGHLPKRVAVDEKYAGQADLARARELGIEVYAPTTATKLADGSRKKPQKGMIPKQDFVWLPEEETYRCPQGHHLKFARSSTEKRQGGESLKLTQYRCPAEHCQACPRREECTRTPQRGRIVKRSEYDPLVEELNGRMRDPEGRKFYKHRKKTIERFFADLKRHRELDQFHGFGLTRARAEAAMLVLALNGMALLKARDEQS